MTRPIPIVSKLKIPMYSISQTFEAPNDFSVNMAPEGVHLKFIVFLMKSRKFK